MRERNNSKHHILNKITTKTYLVLGPKFFFIWKRNDTYYPKHFGPYTLSFSGTTTISSSGDFSLKTIEEKLGYERGETFTGSKTFTLKVPPYTLAYVYKEDIYTVTELYMGNKRIGKEETLSGIKEYIRYYPIH